MKIKKSKKKYEDIIEKLESKRIKQIRENRKDDIKGRGAHKKISNFFKGGQAQPLRVLEKPGTKGVLTTDENEIDQITRNAWDKVYGGNFEEICKMVAKFKKNKTSSTPVKTAIRLEDLIYGIK